MTKRRAKRSETMPLPQGIRRFKPYPEYKESDIEWLGKIPLGWEVERLRFATTRASQSEIRDLADDTEVSFLPMEAIGEHGELSLEATKAIADVTTGYSYFRDGDVIVAKITPCFENGKGALASGLVNGVAFGTTELHVIRGTSRTHPRFLYYITLSHAFRRLGEAEMYGAGGQKRVPESFVRNFPQPLPSLPEQDAIVTFLDRETARIDALIETKNHLVELLREGKTSLITWAVTNGLREGRLMKVGESEWFAQIPADWRVTTIKRLFQHTKRQGFPDRPVLSVYRDLGVIEKASRNDNFNRTPENLNVYQLVNENDLVINKMKAWQGSLGISSLSGITSPDYLVYAPKHSEHSRFLHYFLRNKVLANVFLTMSNGIRSNQWRLEHEKFADFPVLIPPLEEQVEIAGFLDREASRIEALVETVKFAIGHLEELRTALISAAVTGHIDVREEVA